jgi:hypothetical protein
MMSKIFDTEFSMPFREKSAWLMAFVLGLTSAGYFATVAAISKEIGHLVPPLLPLIVIFTVVLAALAAASHIVIALLALKDAVAPADERDRAIGARAGAWSGYVFACGVALGLTHYLFIRNGDVLYYCVFGSWVLSQLSEYAFEIMLYRRPI